MSDDDEKVAEGSNYRWADHHLTVMNEAIMTLVVKAYYVEYPDMSGKDSEADVWISQWMPSLAKGHKAFKLWVQFLLEDLPAYRALRTATRTGTVKLRLAELRRPAPLFCGYVSVQLEVMKRMIDDGVKALFSLFSMC